MSDPRLEYWFQIYIPLSATVLTFLTTSQIRTNYAPYITRVAVTTNVATTNSATKYWTVYFIGYDLPQTGITYIDSFTTAADTVNVLTLHEQAPVYTSTPADRNYLAFYCNLTSTPGAITVYPSFYYRLIVT